MLNFILVLHSMLDVDVVERTTPEQAELTLLSHIVRFSVCYFLSADNSELNTGVQSVLSSAVYNKLAENDMWYVR